MKTGYFGRGQETENNGFTLGSHTSAEVGFEKFFFI